MGVSATRRAEIAAIAADLDEEGRAAILRASFRELEMFGAKSESAWLSAEDNARIYEAVERVVWIEAQENGKGWWFRARRRFALARKYFKPR